MKKVAIVTGGSKNDAPAIGTLVANIRATNPSLADEIVVFHDGISPNDQRVMKSIFPTRFIRFSFPGDMSSVNESVQKYFTFMVFCKYECFRLLSEYRTVIWTDYDIVIVDSLMELLDGHNAGISMISTQTATVRDLFLKQIEEVDMSSFDMSRSAIALPLFVLRDSLPRYMDYYHWCIEKTGQYGKYLYLPEQAIISLLIQQFGIEVSSLVGPYAVHPSSSSEKELASAKILHAYGQPKFWNGLSNHDWEKHYKEWVALGGSQVGSLSTLRILRRKIASLIRWSAGDH